MTQFFYYPEYDQDFIEKFLRDNGDQVPDFVREGLISYAGTQQNRDLDLESYLGQDLYVPSLGLVRSTNQAINDATGTPISWGSISFQSTAVFGWSSGDATKATALQSGIALVVANATFAASAGGSFRSAAIYNNGAQLVASQVGNWGGSTTPQVSLSVINSFVAGDYLEAYCYHDAGAPLNITGQMQVAYLGKAG